MEAKPTFEEIVAKYQRALVLVSHPDDPEFFCGGTVAQLVRHGLTVHYLILTRGDKGSDDRTLSDADLAAMRVVEQQNAAQALGVAGVTFLNNPDGFVEVSYENVREAVRMIRQFRPDIILTTDPEAKYNRHRDHRAAGLISLEAIFPAARNHRYFPELLAEGLEPHVVRELWICRGQDADLEVDVTDVFDLRIQALLNHKSQIRNPEDFIKRMNAQREQQGGRPMEKHRRLIMG